MKIVFNTDQIYKHGGIEKVMATKVNYWANLHDYKVYIITTEQEGNKPCYPIDSKVQLIDLGVNYNRNISYFSLDNIKKVKRHFLKQKAIFKQINPDVIISPNYNFDHYWLPYIKGKAKLFKERHGSRYAEMELRISKALKQKLHFYFQDFIDSKYDKIIVLNDSEKEYVYTNNAVVIPNPINLYGQQAALNNKQVIAAGRISPVKGFEDLIRAWKIVNEYYPDWHLHIYGDNYLGTQEKLQEIINDLNLSHSIIFKYSVDNLSQTMLNYSAYAMTSITECFPMVLLESLSVGLPIVSYDCPNGPRHIITNNEDGYLVENKNIHEFANKLMKLIGNEDLRKRMGNNALKNVVRFNLENVMNKWNALFK
jgi:glycosyltransferase involved in cell wall biosynthesis